MKPDFEIFYPRDCSLARVLNAWADIALMLGHFQFYFNVRVDDNQWIAGVIHNKQTNK